jgi:hypothetical protein
VPFSKDNDFFAVQSVSQKAGKPAGDFDGAAPAAPASAGAAGPPTGKTVPSKMKNKQTHNQFSNEEAARGLPGASLKHTL